MKMSKYDVFVFVVITLSTLMLLTLVSLENPWCRTNTLILVLVGFLICLLFYLVFALVKTTYVDYVVYGVIVESVPLFF